MECVVIFVFDIDFKVINVVFEKMEVVYLKCNLIDEVWLDVDFYQVIIEVSYNVVMLYMMCLMYDLLCEGVFYNCFVMFKLCMI